MIDCLAYQGTSFGSRRIRKHCRGPYSHIARYSLDQTVMDAWQKPFLKGGRTREVETIDDGHEPGTVVKAFQIRGLTTMRRQAMDDRMREMIKAGVKYDWPGIMGFVFKRDYGNDLKKVFCSEWVFAMTLLEGFVELLRETPAHVVDPVLFCRSPLLIPRGTYIVGKGWQDDYTGSDN